MEICGLWQTEAKEKNKAGKKVLGRVTQRRSHVREVGQGVLGLGGVGMRVMSRQRQLSLERNGTGVLLAHSLRPWLAHPDNALNLPHFTSHPLSISCCLEHSETAEIWPAYPRAVWLLGVPAVSWASAAETRDGHQPGPLPVCVPCRTCTGKQAGSGFSRLFQSKFPEQTCQQILGAMAAATSRMGKEGLRPAPRCCGWVARDAPVSMLPQYPWPEAARPLFL